MNSPISVGASRPRNISSASNTVFAVNAEWAFLIAIGILGVITHVSINLPLKLPGHHGLEWMALLLFARTVTNNPWAATIAATSAAGVSYLPVWGFHETTVGLSYLLAGWVVDAGYRWWTRGNVAILGLIAAIAHSTKPLWKWLAAATFGVKFGSVEAGIGVALLCHMLFGFVGGVAGAIAGNAIRERACAKTI